MEEDDQGMTTSRNSVYSWLRSSWCSAIEPPRAMLSVVRVDELMKGDT